MTATLTATLAATLAPTETDRAVALLADGGLVALPTETVYGLAADAGDDGAVARLYAAKGRPSFNPLIVHVLDLDAARTLVRPTPLFESLARAFWPGPLTLVAERLPGASVSALASAGLDTLAVRAPSHPLAREVLARLGRPLVMPSANSSGGLSPTRAANVVRDLGGAIAAVLDGGPCAAGIESTVIDARGDRPALLRAGALPRAAIEAVAGPLEDPEAGSDTAPRSPGRLARHYAPRRARLRLEAEAPRPGEAYLGFGPGPFAVINLSPAGDPTEAAARLFASLRALDEAGYEAVAVAPIPNDGLGEAINDRLRRAATGPA
jgi:L-threonylcarbamoyladenylate synthase